MLRPHPVALVLCALAGTAAPAIDIHYCQDNPPSAAVCANDHWISTCLAGYGSTDPNDKVNNPCQVPQPPDTCPGTVNSPCERSFTQLAYDIYAAQHPGVDSERVFDKSLDNFRPSRASPAQHKVTLDRTSGPGSWANQELMAQYAAWNATNIDPLTYTRVGLFETINGITSCEDYTYYSFMDMERWIDGINACKDDARCKVNVSLKGYTAKGESAPPGISRRRPQNYDGNYIYDQWDDKNHVTELIAHKDMAQLEADPFNDAWQLTAVPKNAFHSGTEYLITPAIFNAMVAVGVPDAQGLADELARGDNQYEMGEGVPTGNGGYYLDTTNKLHQGFYDEFAFHHYMNLTTQNTTKGESREYRRRNDSVTKAWSQLGEDMKCLFGNSPLFDQNLGTCGTQNTPSALGKVRPGDTQIYESDPFQTYAVMSAVAETQMAQPPALFGQIGFGNQLQTAQYTLAQLSALDISYGAQNIPSGAHAPGFLSANAITNSKLFNALNLPAAMVARLSARQVESLAATETRIANILAGQQGLTLFGGGHGAGGGFGGNFGTGLVLGLLGGFNTPGGITFGNGGIGLGLGGGASGGAVPFSLTINSHSNPGGDLSNYVATYTPSGGKAGSTSMMIDQTWSVNPPRWTTDQNGNPILNCATTRPRVGAPVDQGAIADFAAQSVISTLKVDTFFHTEKMWASTCELTNLLLVEWYRKVNGVPSCLDRTSNACDWVPQDFVDRFVTRNISYASAAKQIEYDYCKRWTGGGNITDLATAKSPKGLTCPNVLQGKQLIAGVSYQNRQSLTAMRTFLDKRRDTFECLLKKVTVKAPEVFGKEKIDGNKLGNAEFGGGYSYDLGWTATAVRYPQDGQPSDPAKNGKICRLGGKMDAGFKAFATLFSNEIDIINADVHVLANDNDDHKGVGWANLVVATFTVFTKGDQGNPIDLTGTYKPPDGVKNDRVQFVEAPFQVGWVTVTIKAGIFYDYGATLTLTTQVPGKVCDTVHPASWGTHAKFEPKVDLGVWVSADATIGGAFGVGLEVDLILLGLGLPLTADVTFEINPDDQQQSIKFQAELDFTLTTLKGELDFYIIAFFVKVASFKVVGWDGFVQKFPIFRITPVYIPLQPLTPGAIHPPGQSTASEDI